MLTWRTLIWSEATFCKATHCSATVVLFQWGVQPQQQRWLEAQVPGEETGAAEWECAEGSCHWVEPLKEQHRLERTGRVTQALQFP